MFGRDKSTIAKTLLCPPLLLMKTFQIILFACCFSLLGLPVVAAENDFLTYDKFIAEVETGTVKTATLDQYSQIRGTYTVDGVERPFRSFGDTGSANDILLTRLLKQKNVAITLKDQEERSGFFDGSMLSGLLLILAPVVTLLIALRINFKLNRLSHLGSTPDKACLPTGNSPTTSSPEQPCRPAATTPRALKQFSDQRLATRMLEIRDRGYTFALFLRWSAKSYLLLFFIFGVVLIAFVMTQQWMPLCLMFSMLLGVLLRDIGWVQANGKACPFTLKVTDWDKVQALADEKPEA